MKLYQKSVEPFCEENFRNPSKEYRAAPFWAWNTQVSSEKIHQQIPVFKKMGMGGFFIHCRVGLKTEYLGKEYFRFVEESIDLAKQEGLIPWLYDEDRWPSGSAGGKVTREEKYRSRFLVMEPGNYTAEKNKNFMASAKAVRGGKRTYLISFEIRLDENGYLSDYHVADRSENASEKNIWNCYLEVSGTTPWYNNQTYLNTLDKNAVRKFLDVTHEEFYHRFGERFGTEIYGIFTDEPQTSHKEQFRTPFDRMPVTIPYTDDFEESYQKVFGESLLQKLPEVFWERKDQDKHVRMNYHRHVNDRFCAAYADQVGKWCLEHQIYLTGHMMNEWTLHMQTVAVGDVMRPLKYFGLPGIDMLCDRRELSTLKQAASVAHQFGREGVASEIYGVTGWNFDFRKYKLAGDWQAALGVTFRVPHLAWMSMLGEGKRDYPASIGYQSPWYQKYQILEDYFSRLNMILTRGKPEISIAVLHPIESYWLQWGNQEQTGINRVEQEYRFEQFIQWMLFNLLDFDFISESILAEEPLEGIATNEDGCHGFHIREMVYTTLIIPGCQTIRQSTLLRVETFLNRGGNLIIMGCMPDYLDGIYKKEEIEQRLQKAKKIEFSESQLIQVLQNERKIDVSIRALDGEDPSKQKRRETHMRADNLFYQLRKEGEEGWLFLAHVNSLVNEEICHTEELTIKINKRCQVIFMDTQTGKTMPLPVKHCHDQTWITVRGYQQDSYLFRLIPGKKIQEDVCLKEYMWPLPNQSEHGRSLPPPVQSKIKENVNILDLAEYALDDESWKSEEEILRIDNLIRERLLLPKRTEAYAQPWAQKRQPAEHQIRLRYRIFSKAIFSNLKLALEYQPEMTIFFNEKKVTENLTEYYVDRDIQEYYLGDVQRGENILEVTMPFGEETNLEPMYLLGNFGVLLSGRRAWLCEGKEVLSYGSIVYQGLPFYSDNITYICDVQTQEGVFWIEIPHYRGAILEIELDGKKCGDIYKQPYRLNCGRVTAGKHEISIKLYGNRNNTFGALHNIDKSETWKGPLLWRTEGNKWSYEYHPEEFGILSAPLYWIE